MSEEVAGRLPDWLRAQLAALCAQEAAARDAQRALMRVYLAGAGHDLDALEQVRPVDLDTGDYAFRPTRSDA